MAISAPTSAPISSSEPAEARRVCRVGFVAGGPAVVDLGPLRRPAVGSGRWSAAQRRGGVPDAGLVSTGFPHGGTLAGVCSVFLTLPVAFARRAPVAAALIIVLAAAGNVLIAGRMVRCGVALPAAFWIAFMLGYCSRRPAGAGRIGRGVRSAGGAGLHGSGASTRESWSPSCPSREGSSQPAMRVGPVTRPSSS